MDVPQTITQTVAISLSAGLTWTAALDAAGTLTPILNTSSGSADDDVSITIDSSGYATGTYTTTLSITSADGVAGSPAEVPVTLWVVPDVTHLFLPTVNKP